MKQNDLNTESQTFDKIKRKRGRPKKVHPEDLLDRNIDEHDDLLDYDHHEDKHDVAIEEVAEVVKEAPKLTLSEEKKKYYVDTERLELLIKDYYETEFITDELATCLSNIANRLAYMPNFLNYTWREEMIGDGLIKEFLALKNKKYDPAKGKAFSYFTQIVYNAFRNRIKNENKEHQALREFQDHNFETLTTQHQKITTHEFDGHDNF
jgi:hypothetical protein